MILRIFQIHQHWTLHKRNLLLLDDCFLGKQNKAERYYTRGRHNNCDTIYIAQNYFRLPRQNNSGEFKQGRKKSHSYPCLPWCYRHIPLGNSNSHGVWSKEHNFVTIDLTSTPTNGTYRENFNRFYFPTGTI